MEKFKYVNRHVQWLKETYKDKIKRKSVYRIVFNLILLYKLQFSSVKIHIFPTLTSALEQKIKFRLLDV